MRRYRIGSEIFDENAAALQLALHEAYARKQRPLCQCKEPEIMMYIARLGEQYVVKRMPLTGGDHDPACESYEPPYELSGLGALVGNAIQLEPATGMATLKLDFSLAKTGGRAAPISLGNSSHPVEGAARKLSLKGLLHYLWHEAGLTKWTSNWAGKRHWWNIRWHLLETAKQMIVKGAPLADILFVPEPFRSSNKAAIEQRRAAALAAASPRRNGPRKLMVLVGEVKEFMATRSGQKLIIKHMPGFVFLVDDGLNGRLQVRFRNEILLWNADDTAHLIAIATFALDSVGLAVVEEIALMVVAPNWVPYETVSERKLVNALAKLREQSTKCLRYNLAPDEPIAAALFPRRQPRPVALYIVPAGTGPEFETALDHMIRTRPELDAWIWRVGDEEMPSLPLR
ncbi:DUF1173 domain-containing protein [Mesorhizobium qingshengii]|nr:DUF1173 domain-containing protein [Mesorhizobium qingshengii]